MRLIDADNVLPRIDFHHRREPLEPYSLTDYEKGINWGLDVAMEIVFNAPTAEKRGRWIDCHIVNSGFSKCDQCGAEYDWDDNCMENWQYCPECGAKMEESE